MDSGVTLDQVYEEVRRLRRVVELLAEVILANLPEEELINEELRELERIEEEMRKGDRVPLVEVSRRLGVDGD